MSDTIALECRSLGSELFEILQGFDPARWREEKIAIARARLETFAARTRELIARYESARQDKSADLHAALIQLRTNIDSVLTDVRQAHESHPGTRIQRQLAASYDAFSKALRARSLRLPRNRPTNYLRNLYHVGNAAVLITLVHYVFTPGWTMLLALSFALASWNMELMRWLSPKANHLIVKPFAPFLHPDERWRISSATWFCTALLILSVAYTPLAGSIALAILGVGDPMAAIIGRRFGRHRIHKSRTFEGSGAFVVFGTLASLLVLALFGPEMSFGSALIVSVIAAFVGAAIEVWSGNLDDNLTIPVFAGLGATIALSLVG